MFAYLKPDTRQPLGPFNTREEAEQGYIRYTGKSEHFRNFTGGQTVELVDCGGGVIVAKPRTHVHFEFTRKGDGTSGEIVSRNGRFP